ncbi:MAG: hypothetical protein KKI08_10350 [Armatimonadetes bacterium]|nr:hypothetical protein [Armatimonadota bacterium]
MQQQLLVCGWDELYLLDLAASPPAKMWTWRAADRPELSEPYRRLFGTIDECRRRGDYILITSSGNGVAVLRYPSGEVIFYARAGNAHSVELLPGERLAVAASHAVDGSGDRLLLYALDRPDEPLWSDRLAWAHGVVWDEPRQVLWALGNEELRAYRLAAWDSNAPALEQVSGTELPGHGGHDLTPVPGTDLLHVTGARVFLFDRNTLTFAPHPDLGDQPHVKSIDVHPTTGRMAYVQAGLVNWWSHEIHLRNPGAIIRLPDERIYKARWWAD